MRDPVIDYFKYLLQGDDLTLLREGVEVECKLASGMDGKGRLPSSVWSSYSAFANTNGGIIVLGVKELPNGRFEVKGIENPQQVKKEFFNTINNKTKVSLNILSDKLVSEWAVDDKTLILIAVPRATRKQQPIYLNNNPLGNTYFRQRESDFRLDDEAVKRLLAEQAYDERDATVLDKFGIEDLSLESLSSYRQRYAILNPNAELNKQSDIEFLRRIGGYARDRESGVEGLTKAGLLMFGLHHAITEVFPYFMLDYQEYSNEHNERWADRVVPDGSWNGNLYEFFFRVSRKLTEGLKIPFVLEHNVRQDDTPAHKAIREALVNCLVHADYSDRASILIIKKTDGFSFRNPGLLRIPVEQFFRGGESDARNRKLHQMFRMINMGEQAGSGGPKIVAGWTKQQWQVPYLYEKRDPYLQTVLELKTINLFPSDTIEQLEQQFGDRFKYLSELERAALAIAKQEGGVINHARLQAITEERAIEVIRALQRLVTSGFLQSSGGRNALYTIVDAETFQSAKEKIETDNMAPIKGNDDLIAEDSFQKFYDNHHQDSQRDSNGRILLHQLSLPVIDDITALSAEFRSDLKEIASEALAKKRLSPQKVEEIILTLCGGQFFTTKALSQILNREMATLRKQYLAPLVKEQKLLMAFPDKPTHEKQAYIANMN